MLRLPQMVGTVTFVALLRRLSRLGGGLSPGDDRSPISRLSARSPASAGQPATPGARPNQELMASETFQRAMTDVLRLEHRGSVLRAAA